MSAPSEPTHLSALELDEVASDLAPPPPHLASCAACTQRLERLRTERVAFLARPEAMRQLAQLGSPVVVPLRRRRSTLTLALAAMAVAGLTALAVHFGDPPGDRMKGAPTVTLVDAQGQSVTHASVGQRLTLTIGAAGRTHAVVWSLDSRGEKTPLWSGKVTAGASVPLMELEVTPGDVTVTAEFEGGEGPATASVRLAVP